MVENERLGLFRESSDDILYLIRHAAGSGQTPDDFSFIVGNREFVK